jgi:hypothetical protein
VSTEALYNVDEVQLASLDDIFRKLSDKVAQLESERQAVSRPSTFSPHDVVYLL